MKIDIITVFPEYLEPLRLSLLGKAISTGKIELGVHDLRQWTYDVHRTVDDSPYGGGAGMVMRPEPWGEALDALTTPETHLIVPSPAGAPFTHAMATSLAQEPHLAFACGRYEGIDQRVLDYAGSKMRVTEVSLGDYVLFGGEAAVLVIVEGLARLIPGVLGNAESLAEESHTAGLLEAPVYTKPAQWRGREVPGVLRSGDHARIARWRRDQSLVRTAERRPDLLSAEALVTRTRLDKRDIATLTEAGFPVPVSDMAK